MHVHSHTPILVCPNCLSYRRALGQIRMDQCGRLCPIAFYHIILFFKLTSRWWSDAAFSSARFPDVLIAEESA